MGETRFTVQDDDRATAERERDRMCEALGLEPGVVVQAGGERWMAMAHPARDRAPREPADA
jgi:hypothetical protein